MENQHEDIMIKLFKKKPKINWKYKSWSEVPIDVSEEIYEILRNEDYGMYDVEFKVISLLTDIPEDDLWNLDMDEVPYYTSELSWIFKEFDFPKSNPGKSLTIGDREFTITSDLQDFNIAQYIDFQNLWHKWIDGDKSNKNFCDILTVFLVPKGKKYTTDYKASEVSDYLLHNLPITKANQIFYFFLLSLARSIRATEITYKVMMKILRRRTKTKEEKEKMEMLEQKTTEIINQAKNIFGLLT